MWLRHKKIGNVDYFLKEARRVGKRLLTRGLRGYGEKFGLYSKSSGTPLKQEQRTD